MQTRASSYAKEFRLSPALLQIVYRVSLDGLNRKFSATFLIVKISLVPLLVPLLFIACKTPTVESRKQERLAAYNALPDDQKQMVDKGQIKIGMNEDAVYIAWGPPSQILQSETESGHTTIWMYHGTTMEETRFWTYREVARDGTAFLERYVDRDYYPREYVNAEIFFQNGKVVRWQTLPRPL